MFAIRAGILLLILSGACAGACAANLEVWLDGVRDSEGVVRVALFENSSGFPNASPRSAKVAAADRDPTGRVRVTFSGLVPGRYAIAAFHDSDNDGHLNTNVMGLPTEAYGFSNDARGHFGPPKFDDAAFVLPATDLSVIVHLQ